MLNSDILPLICKKSGIFYILFNDKFEIIEFDENVSYASDSLDHLKVGLDIRDAFWEFVGIEDEILNLKDDASVKINMIFKKSVYYDIEIQQLENEENKKIFIVYLFKKTEFTAEYLKNIQQLNKQTLVLEIDEINNQRKKSNYDLINQNIISFHVDIDGFILEVNSICIYFLGKNEDDILGKHFSVFFHTRKNNLNNNDSKIFTALSAQNDNVFFHADIIPIQENGTVVENIIVCQDITHLKKIEQELEYAVNHDSLTGLANRSLLLKNIDENIEHAKENNLVFSLCFIDLDNFKPVNDTHGHHAGDMLLKHIASVLNDFVRDIDTVARIGGDEFVILFKEIQNQDYLDSVIERIKELPAKNALYYNQNTTIGFGFSLGVGSFPSDAKDAKSLIEFADKEMYKVKKGR